MKPLEVSWTKAGIHDFGGVQEPVQSVNAGGEDMEAIQSLKYDAVCDYGLSDHEVSRWTVVAARVMNSRQEYLEVLVPVQKDQAKCFQIPDTASFTLW